MAKKLNRLIARIEALETTIEELIMYYWLFIDLNAFDDER